MWQYLDNDPFKLKYWLVDTWKQFQFGVRSGFLCHLFHNPQKYSWAHWPSHDWAAKFLINLICPHQNRPNHRVHALARFLSSCQHCGVTHMGVFLPYPFFPKSVLPRSFRECFPYSQLGADSPLLEHQHWHNHSQQQLQPQSRNALAVSHGKAALPAELCGWKTFWGSQASSRALTIQFGNFASKTDWATVC